jgi:hypothetical protein
MVAKTNTSSTKIQCSAENVIINSKLENEAKILKGIEHFTWTGCGDVSA